MPRFVIGTAGHVDHGKTTLVRALTGVDTDRLAEEKRRGISIELGFAPWHVAPDLEATIIDVPGHQKLVHTMIAGASGIELVLLAIAANEGVMPQTREHARISTLLGIRDAVVVLTKTDLVDAETVALAEAEARELLAEPFDVSVVSWSSARPESTLAVRDAVTASLRKRVRPAATGPARLWIDRVFHVRGAGTVVTGTLVAGSLEVQQDLALLGVAGRRLTVARGLRVHEDTVALAIAPTRLAVNLPIAAKEVHRGDLLTTDLELSTTSAVDVAFEGPPLRRGASLSLHLGSTHVPVRVTRTGPFGEGTQLVRLRLAEPRALRGGDRFVLRGARVDAGSLVGGGTVLDARPHPRSRKEARRELADAILRHDARSALHVLLREVTPHPLDLSTLHARLALEPADLAGAADAEVTQGPLVAREGSYMTRETLAELASSARRLVHDHAHRAPLDRGLPVATLHQKLAERAGPLAADAAIVAARARRSPRDEDWILVVDDVAVPASKERDLEPTLARAVTLAREELDRAAGRGASAARIAEATTLPPEGTRALLARLERAGAAVHAGDLWFSAIFVQDLRAQLIAHLGSNGSVTVPVWKNLVGLPRNQAVLLLEHFDRLKLTRRVGDTRVLVKAE